MLRKCASTLVFSIFLVFASQGQITGYSLEVVAVHTGDYGDGVDLNGYITYDLFITTANPDDFLSAVYAFDGGQDININFSCNLFQHELAGSTANNNSCAFWSIAPSMEYDSYLTINKSSSCDAGDLFFVTSIPSVGTVEGLFEGVSNGDYFDGGDLFVQDGTWFTVNNGVNGIAGADLKVKIAQFTTCGSISGCFGVQVFINGDGTNVSDMEICLDALNPCLEFVMDTGVQTLADINCYGETATVELGAGGNGIVTYNLFDVGVDTLLATSQVGDPNFPGLVEGCYFVEMVDELGCVDTSATFCFVEPPQLNLTADLMQDIMCAGDSNGEICFTTVGGTGVVDCQLNGVSVPEGCQSNLVCGPYNIVCSDANLCSVDTLIQLTCPDSILEVSSVIGVSCFADCDGIFSSVVEGGTDSLFVSYTYEGNPYGTPLSTGTFSSDVGLSNLCPGDYEIFITDVNACGLQISGSVLEPDSLVLNVNFANLSCNGDCSGAIELVLSGGTSPYNTVCVDAGGNSVPNQGLCAGDYYCFVTDFQGCQQSDSVTLAEPDPVFYDIVMDSTTCFGGCDGSIFIQNVVGGSGNFSFDLAEGTFVDIAPDSVGYVGLCTGLYNLIILDIDGNCTIVESNLEIGEPSELLMGITTNPVDCYGFANGSIEVECTGGTGEIQLILPDTLPCPALLQDLDVGVYDLGIQDANGCQTFGSTEIIQPDTLIIEVSNIQDVVCGGDCNGSFAFLTTGGVDPHTVFLDGTLLENDPVDLCASNYEICVIDGNNCQSCVGVDIIEPDPVLSFVQETPITCTGMSDGTALVLYTGGIGPLSVTYENPNLDLNNLTDGIYPFSVTDSMGCFVLDTLHIGVNVETDMTVQVFTSPESCWNENDGTATVAVLGGFGEIIYLWDDKDQQTTVTAVGLEADEQYSVMITDSLGCTLTAFAYIEPTVGCLFISNAITPNGDGSNDTWTIGGLEYFPQSSVQVYNRWGQLIFESRGYSVPWDGTHNGNKVPIADYYYIIDVKESESPVLGTVTVKY